MVGSMYFPSITEILLAYPPMYLTTWSRAPMRLAAETALLRWLCDVHLKPFGEAAPMAVYTTESKAEGVAPACQSP
jgi:hypothetical protein